jgi:hypothetical protein
MCILVCLLDYGTLHQRRLKSCYDRENLKSHMTFSNKLLVNILVSLWWGYWVWDSVMLCEFCPLASLSQKNSFRKSVVSYASLHVSHSYCNPVIGRTMTAGLKDVLNTDCMWAQIMRQLELSFWFCRMPLCLLLCVKCNVIVDFCTIPRWCPRMLVCESPSYWGVVGSGSDAIVSWKLMWRKCGIAGRAHT